MSIGFDTIEARESGGEYAARVSEMEPRKQGLVPRHIPHIVVPVPIREVGDFVRDAVRGTSIVNPFVQIYVGWALFTPHLRFTSVDDGHTRIELDLVGPRIAEVLLHAQRLGEIDRFFVAMGDELACRKRRNSPRSVEGTSPQD